MNKDVLYFEKVVNYINICMENKENINVRMTFKEIEKLIDDKLYLRCHSGFIINKLKIKSISSKEIEIMQADKIIPVGRGYKRFVMDYQNNYTSMFSTLR